MSTPKRNIVDEAITDDATEFGLHMRQGGWRLGLLVARNVKIAPGRVAPETLLPKINATEFARRAGTSNDRVIRHYAAWQRAANAGLVPDADTLNPANTVDLNVDRLPAWGPIYNAPIERRTPVTRTPRPLPGPITTRRADPIIPAVADTNDPHISEALESARVNAEDALTALHAHDAEEDEHAAATRPEARDADLTEDVRYAINALMGYARRLFDVAREPEWTDTAARERAAKDIHGLARQLQAIAEIAADPAQGTVTDADLSALLDA